MKRVLNHLALRRLLLVASLIPTAALGAPPPGANPNSVKVGDDQMHQLRLVPAELCEFQMKKTAIGQIAFNEDASTVVLTPFSGRVTRLIAKIGDEVKVGDPLFEVDSPEVVQAQTDLIAAVQSLDKAKSQFNLAKRVLDRQTSLLNDRATSQREVDQARTDFTVAENDLGTAEGALKAARNKLRVIVGRGEAEVARVEKERIINPLITINAPIAGTIVSRRVGPGQYVRSDSADTLFSISDMSTMWLKAYVPESDIALIKVGQELEVKVVALPNRVFRAKVIAIGSYSEAQTRRIMIRSEIPNPDRSLKAEMFVSYRISVGNEGEAPAVPVEAVIREGDGATVWVQSEPQTFERRRVTLGLEQDGRVQIRTGLKAGEVVVARGAIFVDNEWKQ
jgi:cobalt-zinc-cadmium efflux system membrane fusion protein